MQRAPNVVPQVAAGVDAIRQHWAMTPRAGIILGTGLGQLAESIEIEATIGYEALPHFPRSTAVGHRGQLICGRAAGVPVVVMEGRCHAYEGYSLSQITLPVRVMKRLGIELLILSNASGGLNPRFARGDIVVIEDQINLMFGSPLSGVTDDSRGPRLLDMSAAFDPRLVDRALGIARRGNFVAHRGVYVALSGPNYETRAEYRFLRYIGGDVVGMSTAAEVIVANYMSLPVLALSVITNVCRPDALTRTDAAEVVLTAASAEPRLRDIVLEVLTLEF